MTVKHISVGNDASSPPTNRLGFRVIAGVCVGKCGCVVFKRGKKKKKALNLHMY